MSEMKITDKEIEYIVMLAFENVDLECENKRLKSENKNLKMKVKALDEKIKKYKESKIVLESKGNVVILMGKEGELLN